MGFVHSVRQRHVMHRLVAIVLVAGGFVLFKTATASAAAPTISAHPSAGLTGGKKVTVTGSRLAANAKGYVLECNEAPGEPTVYIGPPFDESLPIGCSAPSLRRITSTTPYGTLSMITIVHEGRKLGPPCGVFPVIAGCGHVDSVGKRPHKDAQNYPCPPSPDQQVAGVTCALVFIDTGHDKVSVPISFLGAPTPPATVPPTTPATVPPTTPATVPPTTPGTTPRITPGTTPRTTGTGGTGPSVVPTGAPGPGAKTGSATPGATAPGTVSAGSGSLAFTGLGLAAQVMAGIGAFLLLFGLALYFFDLKRVAIWFLGL